MPEHQDGPAADEQPTERIDRASEAPPSGSLGAPLRPPPPPEDIPVFDDLEEDDAEPPPPAPPPSPEPSPPPGEPVAEPATDRLPEIEEITFAPRPPAQPSPIREAATGPPAPRPPRAPITPTTLSRRRFATLVAFADALIPPGGPIPDSAEDAGVAERLDGALGSFDPEARRRVVRALRAVEWSTVFTRRLRPFSRLAPEARAAAIERAERARAGRRATALLKLLCANQWAASPAVERSLGFTYACLTTDPPRQGEQLEVLRFPAIGRDHREECDVVVVGAGAGGSVIAKELAEIGLSVVVLEEGGTFTRTDFTGAPAERMRRLYRRNGLTWTAGSPPMHLPQGFGVGGSTLVSAGTAMRPPEKLLARWSSDGGLPALDPESMRPFFERVERNQHVQPVPDELLGQNGVTIARGAAALGLSGGPLRRMIEGCRGCGTCSFGCPSDAKLSTHLTYLPRAQRHGATIYAGARVERIVVEGGRARGVTASLLDPFTAEARAALEVRAKLVVLAAGAIHTPALLARNALGNLSGRLGRGLSLHPMAGVVGFFDEQIFPWRGTSQSYGVDEYLESHGVLIEATGSIPSVDAWEFPGAGARFKEMLGHHAGVARAVVFAADAPSGRVVARPGAEPLVVYRLGATDARRLVRGIVHAAEILLAAGARGVLTGLPGLDPVSARPALSDLAEEAIKPGRLRLAALHPSGTARMGADPAEAVCDPWGEVHGIGGLFVADASVLPSCPGVNPQITVMALATRTADHIARHAGDYV